MALKQYLDKAAIITEILANIAKADAYVNQVPYVLAELRVRKIMANPCLSGMFYLNALYKDMQSLLSETEAMKYKETLLDEFSFEQIFNDNNVPAYIAAYKVIELTKSDASLLEEAGKKSLQIKKQTAEQKTVAGKDIIDLLETIQDYSKSVLKTTTTVPYVFLGPYKNYYDALAKFKQTKFYDNKTKEVLNKTKSELKIIGMLPQIHNINYVTTESVIYYIYLDFTKKLQMLTDLHMNEYNDRPPINESDKEELDYILVLNHVKSFEKTATRKIQEEYSKSKYTEKESVHNTLKDAREQFPIEFFYNVTEHISKIAANQLLTELRNVALQYLKVQTISDEVNDVLKLLKLNYANNETGYITLNTKSLITIIGGEQAMIQQKYNEAFLNNQTSVMNLIMSNPLYNVLIKYNPNYLVLLSNLLKLTKVLKKEINALLAEYNLTGLSTTYQQLTELSDIYNQKVSEYNQLKANGNKLTYNELAAAANEYLNRHKEYYESLVQQAEEAKKKQSTFMQDFVADDNKIVLCTTLRPKTVTINYNFKTLKANFFKPELDKALAEIKKEYKVQKVFKTDPDTGMILKPLVLAGLAYPLNWPYKNLYIDTVNYNEWLQKKLLLLVLRDQYQMLPDQIPAPNDEDPSMIQTFGSGADTVVQQQPPPDPWCDKYFPKNYAALFGVPNLIPSLLTVEELLFDELKKPIMIKDPNGMKDEQGNVKLVQKTKKHPVAIENGYAYVDTGVIITLCYTVLPLLPTSILIPGVGMDYGSIVAGYFTPLDPEAMELVETYPYQNDQANGRVWWMMNDGAGVIFKALAGDPPIMIKFRVYLKYNIPCGYPKKCGTLTNEQMELNGKCGLQDFLSKPLVIDTEGLGEASPRNGVLTQTESIANKVFNTILNLTQGASEVAALADRTICQNMNFLSQQQKLGYNNIKTQTAQWKNASRELISNTWNISKVIMTNDLNKTAALQSFTETISDMLPSLTDVIPPECRYIICNSQREAQQTNCILSFSDNVKNSVKSAGLLANDMLNSAKDQVTNVAKGMGNLATVAAKGANNLVKTFNLYQLCARRFNDYLKDANPIGDASPIPLLNKNGFKVPDKLNVFTQMQNIFAKDIVGGFIGMLNNCITKNATKLAIKDSPLIPGNVKMMLHATNEAGNLLLMNKILQSQGTNLNAVVQQMNSTLQNPLGKLPSVNNIALTGISVDQIKSLANNTVLNTNGIKVTAGSLNGSLLSNSITQNLIKDSSGTDLANVINLNNTITDQLSATTDLNIEAQKIVDTSNFSDAKNAIYNALGDNAETIKNMDITNSVSINTGFKNISDSIESDNFKWVVLTSNDINAGLTVALIADDMNKFKSPQALLGQLGDISTVITTRMLQKSMRKAADKAENQMSANMALVEAMNQYIIAKQNQLARLNK